MAKRFPIHPARPERICWGCDKYCAADEMACSNERAPHPVELFGEDWLAWGDGEVPGAATDADADAAPAGPDATQPAPDARATGAGLPAGDH